MRIKTLPAGRTNTTGARFPAFRRNYGGFTLLELIVVLVIVSLMSALIAPRLTGPMRNLDLKTAAKRISASLRYARSRAATEKAIYVALFDFDNNRLIVGDTPLAMRDFLINDQAAIKRVLTTQLDRHPERLKLYQPPEGIKLEKGISRENTVGSGFFPVFFFPTGASSGGEIMVANQRGRQYSVTIDFITGMVRLSEVMTS